MNGSSSANLRHERTPYRHIRTHAINSRSGGMLGLPFAATIRAKSGSSAFNTSLHIRFTSRSGWSAPSRASTLIRQIVPFPSQLFLA